MNYDFKWQVLYRHYRNISESLNAWKQITGKLDSYSLELYQNISSAPSMNDINQEIPDEEKFGIMFQNIKSKWEQDDYQQLVQSYRKAGVLTIYSIIESHLRALTKEIESFYDFNLNISDLNSRDYILQYIKYLEKIFLLNTEEFQPFLTKIQQQKIIRNKIAHNNNVFNNKEVGKIKKVNGVDLKKIDEDTYSITIEQELIDNLIISSESFFYHLIHSIDKRYCELLKQE